MNPINWAPWLHGGLLSSQVGVPNNNMLSYTAQAAFFTDDPIIKKGLITSLKQCQVQPGVYSRHPGTLDNTQIDDYLSLACLPVLAGDIESKMWSLYGFLDVNSPNKPSFNWKQQFFRFPALVTHLQFAQAKQPGIGWQIVWCIAMFICTRQPTSNQDAWMQSDLMAHVYESSNAHTVICDLMLAYWLKFRPNMKEVVLSYLKGDDVTDWPEHPLVRVWPA